MQNAIFLLLGSVAVFVAWFLATFNRGVRLRQNIVESRANIDVQLKRRHDLVPNLVAVCKGYASHEQAVFESISAARANAIESLAHHETGYETEAQLVSAMNRLVALVEAYPQIKADSQFLALQKELVNTEDRIAAARRFYNANCRGWNVLRESFPSSLVVKGPEAFYYEVEGVDLVPVIDLNRS
ncbi:MAG: LemA family protein [Armatimonadetes bacterium]|nr:LemA family protein [Armatimonadota bacterium]